jgi:hypothetical protein
MYGQDVARRLTLPDAKRAKNVMAVPHGDVSRLVCISKVPFFVIASTAAIRDFVDPLH